MTTTHFTSPLESTNYLKLLGATEIEIPAFAEAGYDKNAYLLDNILFHVDREYRSLYTYGIPKNIKVKINKSSFSDCFYEEHVFNLEGLVYLYSLIHHGEMELEDYYAKKIYEIRNKTLDSVLLYPPITLPRKESLNPVRDVLNDFDSVAFLPSRIESQEEQDAFLDSFDFNTTGFYDTDEKDDCIRFNWSDHKERIHGGYYCQPGYKETYLLRGKHYDECIYHFYDRTYYEEKADEMVRYDPVGGNDSIFFNLTLGTVKINNTERKMTDQDYEFLARKICSFTTKALNVFREKKQNSNKGIHLGEQKLR